MKLCILTESQWDQLNKALENIDAKAVAKAIEGAKTVEESDLVQDSAKNSIIVGDKVFVKGNYVKEEDDGKI